MQIIYTGEPFPEKVVKSMFLAGPTPRNTKFISRIKQIFEYLKILIRTRFRVWGKIPSWRPEALRILEKMGYDGHVFVPEDRPGSEQDTDFEYHSMIDWETEGLNRADIIVFWVPRDLKTMPAFTTNIEWGAWRNSGKVVFGAPANSPKNRYLELESKRYSIPIFRTLEETLSYAANYIGNGAERTWGECKTPLYIWNTESFQAWYKNLKNNGNRLEDAEVLWTDRKGPKKDSVFAFGMKAKIYIPSENRYKASDLVITRRDISTVVLWQKNIINLLNSEIIMVKEFRSTARTPDGFIHELPGGSTPKKGVDPSDLAQEEVFEETGLHFEKSRFKFHCSRQLAGTFSAHHSYLFSVRLTDREMDYYKQNKGIPHGDDGLSERTYIEVKTLKEILTEKLADWSTLGMIMQVISEN